MDSIIGFIVGTVSGCIIYLIVHVIKSKLDNRKLADLESRQMEVKLELKDRTGAIIGSVLSVEIKSDKVVLHFIDGESKIIKLTKVKSLVLNTNKNY